MRALELTIIHFRIETGNFKKAVNRTQILASWVSNITSHYSLILHTLVR